MQERDYLEEVHHQQQMQAIQHALFESSSKTDGGVSDGGAGGGKSAGPPRPAGAVAAGTNEFKLWETDTQA
jgi:hypothetical protein